MKSTPLLMKGPLVRRSLDGRKRMTRRLLTPPITYGNRTWSWERTDGRRITHGPRSAFGGSQVDVQESLLKYCPYGTVGDELWGRETFAEVGTCDPLFLTYRATYPDVYGGPTRDTRTKLLHGLENIPPASDVKWRPAIFMPREACRLVMPITEIRLEQLQAITEADILAEGVGDLTLDELIEMGATRKAILKTAQSVLPRTGGYDWMLFNVMWPQSFTLRERFQIVWDLLYGLDPTTCWDANPWVWVISYKRKEPSA